MKNPPPKCSNNNNLAAVCGINVIIDKKKRLSAEIIEEINPFILKRGPDGLGLEEFEGPNERFFIANSRLAIRGVQQQMAQLPFLPSNNTFVMAYNGEIYNVATLTEILTPFGYTPQTDSDAEVLAWGLYFMGKSFLEKVNGMFAFVFVNKLTFEVLIGVDPLGMKSLYVFENDEVKIISSDNTAILHSRLVSSKVSQTALNEYLTYKHVTPPATFLDSISKIKPPPFAFSTVQKDKRIDIKEWETKLTEALARHLVSEKPVGLMLSGGVDSSLLALLLKRSLGADMPAFATIDRMNDVHREKWFVEQLSHTLGLKTNYLEYGPEWLDSFPEMVGHLHQPIADPAALLTYQLSKRMKADVSVAFSGAGADELLIGYRRHLAFLAYLHSKKYIPKSLWPAFIQMLTMFGRVFLSPSLQKVFRSLKPSAKETFLSMTSLFPIGFEPKTSDWKNPKEEFWKWDMEHFLAEDVLAMTDQLSMAVGLEVRLPYLDKEWVEFVSAFSVEEKTKHGLKWPLKAMLKNQGFGYIANRQKHGFGFDIHAWIRQRPEWIENLRKKEDSLFEFFSFEETQKIINQHVSNQRDAGQELWAIQVASTWIRLNHLENKELYHD